LRKTTFQKGSTKLGSKLPPLLPKVAPFSFAPLFSKVAPFSFAPLFSKVAPFSFAPLFSKVECFPPATQN